MQLPKSNFRRRVIDRNDDRNDHDHRDRPCQPVRVAVDHFRAHFSDFATLLRDWLCCRTVQFETLEFVFKFLYSSLEFLDHFWRFHGAVWSLKCVAFAPRNQQPADVFSVGQDEALEVKTGSGDTAQRPAVDASKTVRRPTASSKQSHSHG